MRSCLGITQFSELCWKRNKRTEGDERREGKGGNCDGEKRPGSADYDDGIVTTRPWNRRWSSSRTSKRLMAVAHMVVITLVIGHSGLMP